MRKIFSVLVFTLLLHFTVVAKESDTIHVISHNKTIVVTDPATGVKAYRSWAVFPSAQTKVRRINLKVTFGCPDSLRCADWDYLDHIYIRRKGGMDSASLDYPIGRMLTPYGGAFAKDWSFEWDTEITDFSLLLRDSVEIEYQHTGYEPANDRGWKITVDFEIVKGEPVMEPVSITKIYDGSFRYGDAAADIETQLKPVTFTTAKNAVQAKLLVYQTGHGMDSSGCGEFCDRYREIWFDGKMIDKRNIWRECGDNPLYPQAGTWIIDRAYWCPGYLQHPDKFELPLTNGKAHVIDINMQPYVTQNPSANEVIAAYLVQYKKAASQHDAAIEDVIVPTDKQLHLRSNPSSVGATIILKNLGAAPLRQANIEYGTAGFAKRRYQWKGNLPFNQEDTVRLPGVIQGKPGNNFFNVNVVAPNGKKDGYATDNRVSVSFSKVPVHGREIIVNLFTNKQAGENNYEIRNSEGKVLYERKTGTLANETNYRDTVKLAPGSYEFVVNDTGDNGLEFWFNVRGGRGFVRLLDAKGRMIKNFDSDFGSSIYYGFEVTNDTSILTPAVTEPAVGVFPTRTKGKTTMDYFGNTAQKVVVKLVTDPGGETVEEHVYELLKEGIFTYDLSYRPAQRYYLKVFVGDKLVYNKRVRVGQ
ncbi:MAG: peptide-N-glycosidase F-related protein [Agriterribacter sp.]